FASEPSSCVPSPLCSGSLPWSSGAPDRHAVGLHGGPSGTEPGCTADVTASAPSLGCAHDGGDGAGTVMSAGAHAAFRALPVSAAAGCGTWSGGAAGEAGGWGAPSSGVAGGAGGWGASSGRGCDARWVSPVGQGGADVSVGGLVAGCWAAERPAGTSITAAIVK